LKWEYASEDGEDYEWEYSEEEDPDKQQQKKGEKEEKEVKKQKEEEEEEEELDEELEDIDLPDPFSTEPVPVVTKKDVRHVKLLDHPRFQDTPGIA
jgi:hypothetical protein